MTPAARGISIWFLYGLLILQCILVFGVISAVATADDDEEGDSQEEEFAVNDDLDAEFMHAERSGQAFDELVFANDHEGAAAVARDRLTPILQQRVECAVWAGELTDAQYDKLLLAGRGDIKRLIDRIEAWKERSRPVCGGDDAAPPDDDQRRETASLGALLESGPFEENSLFAKILRNVLTPEQMSAFETIRQIERDGGRIIARDDGSHAGWGIGMTDVKLLARSLTALMTLRKLRSLSLDRAPVTDADLVHLKDLTDLEHLDLSHTQVTDHGLAQLQVLAHLRALRLNRTEVTDAGLQHLQRLHSLEELSLAESKISDQGLEHLEAVSSLRSLDLSGTRVTDSGLKHLQRLAGLERLYLDDTDVTDAGLNHLKRLKDLEYLSCRRTTVTHAGTSMLRRWRPRLLVED
jgi:hypothetical protein